MSVPLGAQPATGERALLIEGAFGRTFATSEQAGDDRSQAGAVRVLIAGDLHVGLEAEFARGGLRLPSQTRTMRERLDTLVQETRADHLVVIGDLKHAIPVSSFQEARELSGFFAGLPCPVTLVRGNHDVDLPPMANARVHDDWALRLDGGPGARVLLLHGHTWPDEGLVDVNLVVTCHNHPMVQLNDDLGRRHKEPCWVRGGFTEVAYARYPALAPDARFIILPAFNDLLGGVAFNGREGARLLGPLLANGLVDVEHAMLFTLDGVRLGAVKELRRFAKDKAPIDGSGRAAARKRPGGTARAGGPGASGKPRKGGGG